MRGYLHFIKKLHWLKLYDIIQSIRKKLLIYKIEKNETEKTGSAAY